MTCEPDTTNSTVANIATVAVSQRESPEGLACGTAPCVDASMALPPQSFDPG